ncbi:MAG: hypothetical protein JSV84_10070 [Gemmatimonadota bacterium]|nr:MAG: hypothetical protein JSV84_10070 [Gemmatimonadota bacterium]
MAGIDPIDLVVILMYFAAISYIGLRSSKRVKDTGDFFMGGRKFGKLLMVAKAFGVGTRADLAVAVSGASYQLGLSGIWYQWLYIFSTPFYWIVAPIYRRLRYLTTGDFFEERYGRSAGTAYTVIALLYFSVTIGTVLRGIGTTVEAITRGQLSGNLTIFITTLVFVGYSATGGLVAAVSTKLLQGTLLLVLSLLLIPFSLSAVGGFSGLHKQLVPEMISQVARSEVTLFFIIMVVINALVGVVSLPHHMAVGGAGKTEMNCRTGWTYGNVTKRVVTLFWAFLGLFAAVLFPGLGNAAREQAFGMMITHLLPAGMVGLMIAAMIASVMALCDAFMVDGSALFTRNIYKKYVHENRSEKHYLTVARWSSVGVVAIGILIAFFLSNVISGLKALWTIMAFTGIPFWMAISWRRGNRYGFWASVIVTSGVYFLTRSIGWSYPAQIVAYLSTGTITFIVTSLVTVPEPEKKLHAFYALLHTPVGEEYKLRNAGVEIVHEGTIPEEGVVSENDEPDATIRSLEDKGHGLLIVDLLQLFKTFSFRKYRIDIVGFAAAWGLVLSIILLAVIIARIGA